MRLIPRRSSLDMFGNMVCITLNYHRTLFYQERNMASHTLPPTTQAREVQPEVERPPVRHGPQPGFKHTAHMTKADVRAFAAFCLREDIANQLQQVVRPHQLAVKLYEKETGIKVPESTAYRQRGRWMLINGELCEIRKAKDFRPPPKPPRQPKRPRVPRGTIPLDQIEVDTDQP